MKRPHIIQRTSPKHCSKCGEQGECIDTRQQRAYVRRRYRCIKKGCKERWTTNEIFDLELVKLRGCQRQLFLLRGVISDTA